MTDAAPSRGQSDYDKLRRLPWLYGSTVMTATAVLCTVSAPLTLFAAEIGLGEDRIGLLSGIMPFFQGLGVLALPVILRFGSRRIAATALSIRYLFLTLFLVALAFVDRPDVVFSILLIAMLGFAVCRSLAEAALVPWSQEFMPKSVRGRIAGRMALAYVPVALGVSWAIQVWLDSQSGLGRFVPVFVLGILIGIAGGLMLLGLRGGRPKAPGETRKGTWIEPLRDRNYAVFLFASALQNIVATAISLFLILYFRERIGISSGALVLQVALIPVGSAAGNVTAGWFVDRYGTRAIRTALQIGQILLLLILPFLGPEVPGIAWFVPAAFFLFGFLFQAAISVANVYMLNVIPPSSKEAYTAMHYSIDGFAAGLVTFAAGILLAWLGTSGIEIWGVAVGNFEVLFILAAVVTAISATAFGRLSEDGALSVREFVDHFTTGNPMKALWGINRYASRTSEDRRRDLAFQFSGMGSPLAKEELIAALRDPSFDVRHEAIRALGHIGAHPAVVQALEAVLDYDGLVELRYAALGSLGRLKAMSSAPRVAALIQDPNPLLRARAARSLGEIGYWPALPGVRHMLESDPELDCRLAAASAVGKFKDRESMQALASLYLSLAEDRSTPMAEMRSKVVLLAITKILSCEEEFSHQWRREEAQPGLVMPGLLLRLARLTSADSAELRAVAADYDAQRSGDALSVLVGLMPDVKRSSHPDAELAAYVLAQVGVQPVPNPALIVALAAILGRVLAA
ncbi:MFS transporter [Flavimaricola marinus]|uniref:Major Facilitator Superfamily protein n=1 Tax=Flavimaricola marinus TaxID=1819565 RepID=A0A238LGL4_9RHOB|nr:MFS transporter [Flavimaricola marinus]SMY08877.1 Major Facilitator Superfamily protein [Flavimaricola marinus]